MIQKDNVYYYEPYLLNRIVDLTAVRINGKRLKYKIKIDKRRGFTSGVIWRPGSPNPWLSKLLSGKNPGKDFLQKQVKNLSSLKPGQELSLATEEFPIRWASGGGMLILKDCQGRRFVPLNIRARDGLYPLCLDANGGLSNRVVDWLEPRFLGLREILEELILVSQGKIVLPILLKNQFDRESDWNRFVDVEAFKERQLRVAGSVDEKLSKSGRETIPIREVTPENFKHLVEVCFQGETFRSEAIVAIDPTTAAIDLRNVYEIEIEGLNSLVIIDGETKPDQPFISRDRAIYLFSLSDLLKRYKHGLSGLYPVKVFQGGREVELALRETSCRRLTPVLRSLLKALA